MKNNLIYDILSSIMIHKDGGKNMFYEQLFDGVGDSRARDISIGNGYALEWIGNKGLVIYRYGVCYKQTEINVAIDRRRIAVELVLEGGVTKSLLADALKVSRQSIDNWINIYKTAGFEGLVNSYKGSKEKGRKENADNLPRGNKARQLEQERRQKREEKQKNGLLLGLDIEGKEDSDKVECGDTFKENHEFEKNHYAGGFLYWGIFQSFFGFQQLCASILGASSVVEYLFSMMLVHGIESVEQLKTVFKREFGKIIGVKQLFSKPVLWEKIHEACSLSRSKLLIEDFFMRQARKGLISLWWLYLDGHFIPYYGEGSIHKGYYTQRDQMMPGQTEMFVHDCQGRVVYFELQEGKGDIKEIMRRMSEKWSAYIGGVSPLIVVDRASWGVEHFLSLKGHRFITWEKFSEQDELAAISEECFGPDFDVNGKGYKAFEDKKTYKDKEGHSIELRRIIIWNKGTDRRVVCVAQDEIEDTATLACAMLGRWGNSENSFKHMGDRCSMHYNPVLDVTQESENQEIANPEYERLKKKVLWLKKGIAKYERELGRLPIMLNKDGKLRKSKKRERFQDKRYELEKEVNIVEESLKICPERVRLDEVKGDETFKKVSTEGKNLWDVAEALVWNSRKKLIEIFKDYLPNERDLIPVLEAITRCHGWIKSTSEAIEIRLEPLDTPRFRVAQIQLCTRLNEMNIRLNNGKLLLYDVGHEPDNVQKNSP